jgi:hypothetical protein
MGPCESEMGFSRDVEIGVGEEERKVILWRTFTRPLRDWNEVEDGG